jgi:sterol desaturase/sphingolipid hydroxylase (fatty acid hydroxylase superfamily)
LLTAVVQVSALVAFSGAGLLWPRRDQPLIGRDTAINLVTGAVLVVIRWTLLAALLSRLGPGLVPVGQLPLVAQLLAGFLILDFSRWALHLAHHRVPFLWSFHRVHHSTPRLDATSGLRMHVVDFVQLAALPALLFSVVFDTSASPEWLVPVLLVPGVVFDAFEHANLRFPIRSAVGRTWDAALNNPHFHAWHHTDEGHLCDGNYGNVLTIWDRLFGTCVSRDELPAAFGLDSTQRLVNDPLGLQLLRRPEP